MCVKLRAQLVGAGAGTGALVRTALRTSVGTRRKEDEQDMRTGDEKNRRRTGHAPFSSIFHI